MASGKSVLVATELDADGALRPVSLETLTAGRQVADATGGDLVAVVVGNGVGGAATQVAALGANRVLVADDAGLAGLTAESMTAALAAAVATVEPFAVIVPGTTLGRDAAPRLAARLATGLAADCVGFAADDDALVATRPVLGGRAQTQVRLAGPGPRVATLRAGSFPKATASGATGTVEALAVALGDADLRVRVAGVEPKSAGATSLDAAEVVVSGGRGLKEAANFALVEELAAVLGGAVGATRAVVDLGWRPHQEQIGQTGRSVSPRLYIAVGISGAVQHNVGMQGSEAIVAINRDPDAPIFKVAAYGIVGDLFEVVPALTAELKDG